MPNKKHPKALTYLFLTELWERYGFYIVQGMLVLYLTKALGFPDDDSYTISGLFTALAYISPMFGGFIADRFLGFEVTILWGGIFLIVGYALLAFLSLDGFYFALATIIIGTGLFKPNISSLLGALYKPDDPGRDSGFTFFYIGINVGIFLAGLSSGFIKDYFGWKASFGFASIGLIISLITFFMGLKNGSIRTAIDRKISPPRSIFLSAYFLIFYCIIANLILGFLLKSSILGNWLLPAVGVCLVVFMFTLVTRLKDNEERKKLIMLNVLIISSVVFWALFWQMFFSVNLFIDRLVDRRVFGIELPTTVFYTLESIFIILFGPALAWSWQTLNENERNPSPMMKFILAIVIIGLGFFVLAICTHFYNASYLVNPLWIVLAYFLITTGEMLLSPIGLSAVTTLSPPHLTGMMMGIWFAALGFGGQFAGVLAKLSSVEGSAQDALVQLPIYGHAFMQYAYLAFGVAIVLFFMHIALKRLLR